MIYAYNVLKGYTAIRGTLVFHLPMAIATLIFIRVPRSEQGKLAFPGAEMWYVLSVILHFV